MAVIRHQFRALRLRDFRCFHDDQSARLAPLTLLVGDNSTGKTSFLAAIRAIWEFAYQSNEPDFRAPPYDLGAFSEIVHNPGKRGAGAASFDIGFSGTGRGTPLKLDVTFESLAAAPYPAAVSLEAEGLWLKCPGADGMKSSIDFGSMNGSWRLSDERKYRRLAPLRPSLIYWIRRQLLDLDEVHGRLDKLGDGQDIPSEQDLTKLSRLLRAFYMFPRREEPFASAPIRSSPRRTYDTNRLMPDPEGAYVPTYFASINFRDQGQWKRLKSKLEEFGRDSGLFHEIGVKQLGDMEGGPFQLEVRKYGKKKGRKRNLIDVGYGVSQVLPVIAELFRPDGPPMFLFQQPEVHLHPSAQAALGSLFCETATTGRQVIVETHSDYILDRILLDIRDKRTELKAEEVSILYFEREDQDVSIHSIRIDAEGKVLDTPESYRNFFRGELDRVIKY